MAGVVGNSEEGSGGGGPGEAAACEGAVAGGEDPAAPREDGDEIEIAEMDEEDVAEAEGETGEECGGPAAAEGARQGVDAERSPPEMADAEQLHPAIVEGGIEQEEQQVGGIEESGLNVGDEWRAAVEVGIPERQLSLADGAGGEAVDGEEEADQVAAVGRLVDGAADGAPEEGCEHCGQQGSGQKIPAPLVTAMCQPCNCAGPEQQDESPDADGQELCSSSHGAKYKTQGMALADSWLAVPLLLRAVHGLPVAVQKRPLQWRSSGCMV